MKHIEVRPDVLMGRPCLKGTRSPVHLILERRFEGEACLAPTTKPRRTRWLATTFHPPPHSS